MAVTIAPTMRAGTMTTMNQSVLVAACRTLRSWNRNFQFASPTHSGGLIRSTRLNEK